MLAGHGRDLAGGIDVLDQCAVALAGDAIGVIVLAAVGILDIGVGFDAVAVERRRAETVGLLDDFAGEAAGGIVPIGRLGAVGRLHQLERQAAIGVEARQGREKAGRIVNVVLSRIVLALDVVGPDVLAAIS